MMKLNEYLKILDGCEILSMNYEGCVGVQGDKVICEGVVVDTLDTIEKASALFGELCQNEGIY